MVVLPLKWENLEQEATFHMLLHILNFTSGAEVQVRNTQHRGISLVLHCSIQTLTRYRRPEFRSPIAIWLASERAFSWVFWACTWKGANSRPLASLACPYSTSAALSACPSLLKKRLCPASGKTCLHLIGRWSSLCIARFKMAAGYWAREILRGDSLVQIALLSRSPFKHRSWPRCSFGQCLLSGVDSGYVSQTVSPVPLDALATVSRLVRIFPFLRDEVKLGDKCVGLYSKAQQMVMYFHDILGPRVPACEFTNMNALTGCCDNYTLAVLRKLNVVSLSEELSSKIDSRQDFRAGSETEVCHAYVTR